MYVVKRFSTVFANSGSAAVKAPQFVFMGRVWREYRTPCVGYPPSPPDGGPPDGGFPGGGSGAREAAFGK
ncbi:hypothetical protein GCM10027073_08610 [Streptomyces chlorus]